MDLLRQWKFPLLIGVLLSVLYIHYFENRAYVRLEIKVSQTTWFKIYWAGEGQLFSEKKAARVRVRPNQEKYHFFLTDLRKITKLRIDPHQYEGEATIKEMVISQNGLQAIRFVDDSDFSRLVPISQVAGYQHEADGFRVLSNGDDPNFQLPVELTNGPSHFTRKIIRIAGLFAAVFLFFYCTVKVREEKQFVPLFFAAVFALVIVMASISAERVHPDEAVHLNASRYYMSNWLPPAIDDPSIRDTYSVYGFSRLNSKEISYFFTGKLAQLIAPLQLPDYLGLRMFNVLLFGIILLYIFRREQAWLVAVPFLLSPQLWYVFSYCNSDAFALTIAFLAGCQLVFPDSLLGTYLSTDKSRAWFFRALLLGLSCSLLFLAKKNYVFFILFAFGYLFWRSVFYEKQGSRTRFFKRIALLVLIGMCITGLRIAVDYSVNGFDRSRKIAQLREELAAPMYKPSTPLVHKHPFLYRKARGDSLEKLVNYERWFGKTFRSAFGSYSYFSVSGSDTYFNFVRWVGALFLGYFFLAVLARGGLAGNLLLFLGCGCAAGLIGASLWHSWTADFQTQGRYLFPIAPILGMLVFHTRRYMPDTGFKLFLVTMFMLSTYSFIYVALLHIPKAMLAAG